MADDATHNTHEAIAAAWDRLCSDYVEGLAALGKRKALAAIELAAIRREIGERRGLRILDAGCGPGWHGNELARDGHTVVMLDVSTEMLQRAEAWAEEEGVRQRVSLVQRDIRQTAMEAGSFDAVISCGTVVSDCGDPDAALAESARLLKPGGMALFSVRNLWVSLDRLRRGAGADGADDLIEFGRARVTGHQAFDWTLFTPEGLEGACGTAGIELQRVYPVGIPPPPDHDADVPACVKLHLQAADSAEALKKAHELFAAAKKGER